MASGPAVVVTLDGRVHDPDVPLLHADDLAALRGDGVFETVLVRDGRACLLEAHLDRLAGSAALLDLPTPDPDQWRRAAGVALRGWTDAEGALRLLLGRGREGGGPPTAYLTLGGLPARIAGVRRDGVAALTLPRGVAAEPAVPMPWLLAGAKTLSYAVNMAALRHAERRGAGDVVFVGSDGLVLEGPRSAVVIAVERAGRTALITPPPEQPILHGIAQRALFAAARAAGIACAYEPLREADLRAARGVWLVSSLTLAARVHTLDGTALAAAPLADRVRELLDAAMAPGFDSALDSASDARFDRGPGSRSGSGSDTGD